jgi:hypothetical protein
MFEVDLSAAMIGDGRKGGSLVMCPVLRITARAGGWFYLFAKGERGVYGTLRNKEWRLGEG